MGTEKTGTTPSPLPPAGLSCPYSRRQTSTHAPRKWEAGLRPLAQGPVLLLLVFFPTHVFVGGGGCQRQSVKGSSVMFHTCPSPPRPSSQGTFNLPLHLFYWSQRQPLNTNKEFPNSLTNAPSSHMRWNLLAAPWTKVLGHWWQTSLMPFTYNSEYPHWTSCLLWFGTFRTYHSRLMYSFCCLPTFDTIFWSCPQEPFQIPGPWVVTYPVLQSTQVGFKPKPYLPQSAPSRCTPPSPAV